MKLVPPPHLIDRVFPLNNSSVEENQRSFVESGERSVREIVAALQLCGVHLGHPDLLDWGCGPGRVDLRLLEQFPELRLTGVDVDAGSIDWLRAVCPQARFSTVPLLPPTELSSSAFDICINHSVLTHLDREPQKLWLREIVRVLRVNGILLTSVHGMKAILEDSSYLPAASAIRDSWVRQWREQRFFFVNEDSHTGSVHHEGYHTTFQDPSTVELFSDYALEPLLFAFHGDLGHQDLLVLRKRSPEEVSRRRVYADAPSEPGRAAPAAPVVSSNNEELIRAWTMAAASMTKLGNQVARLEDELLRLKLQVARDPSGA